MPTMTLPLDLATLQEAASAADLKVIIGQGAHAITVSDNRRPLFTRPPHRAQVREEGRFFVIVWPDHVDGLGLTVFIGHQGERLRTFFILAALEKHISSVLGEPRSMQLHVDEAYTTITCEGPMQQKIIVRVDRKGGTTLRTEGFEGPACIAATAGLQEKLGLTLGDEATNEMNQVAQAEIQTSQGN